MGGTGTSIGEMTEMVNHVVMTSPGEYHTRCHARCYARPIGLGGNISGRNDRLKGPGS